jgi:6-phosphogluconolactonase (cycloisomerase 2 family)
LYATADQQQGSVYEFQIDTNTGKLTAMAGSPFKADIGMPTFICTNFCGSSLVADPLGRFLYYQYNYGSVNALNSLTVDQQTGALSNNSRFDSPVYELSADPQGRYLYWNKNSGSSNAVGGLTVSSTGALSLSPGQPYVFAGQTSYGSPAVTGNYVFVLNYLGPSTSEGNLFEYAIDSATGTLTQTNDSIPIQQGGNPVATPDGKFVYVLQLYFKNNIGYWEIVPLKVDTNGAFVELNQFIQQTPALGTFNVWMSPNGNFLLASVYGQIWDFQINKTTGELTLVKQYTDINTSLLAIDPEVKFIFTSPTGLNQVETTTLTSYSVNPNSGELTPVADSTVDIKAIPLGLAVVSPSAAQ